MDTEIIASPIPLDYTKESIKLVKNSRGYTWEIKIVPEKGINLNDDDLKRLHKKNEQMVEKFGEEAS